MPEPEAGAADVADFRNPCCLVPEGTPQMTDVVASASPQYVVVVVADPPEGMVRVRRRSQLFAAVVGVS
jgi:hypothetical protein